MRLGRGSDDFDATALPSSAGVDLDLDDGLATQVLGGLPRLFRCECHLPLGYGHTILAQKGLGLILVDLDAAPPC